MHGRASNDHGKPRHEQRRKLAAWYRFSSAPERRPSAGQPGLAADRVVVAITADRKRGITTEFPRQEIQRRGPPVCDIFLRHLSPILLRQGGFGDHSGQSGIYVANRKESVPDWSSGLLCIQNGTGRRTKKERCARDV
jgi:hypothetical protein